MPVQLLPGSHVSPKTWQHIAVTPIVQAHTLTAAVWE